MKLITAIVRPFTLDRIIVALEELENFPGITVSEAEGFGKRGSYDALRPFKEEKRIEIACDDNLLEQILAAIHSQAHTGKKGDGMIFITPIETAVLI